MGLGHSTISSVPSLRLCSNFFIGDFKACGKRKSQSGCVVQWLHSTGMLTVKRVVGLRAAVTRQLLLAGTNFVPAKCGLSGCAPNG